VIDRYVSPSEFKRLLSALLVVAGFISIVAVFAFLVVPGIRNVNEPQAEVAVNAVQGESGWLDPGEYPASARKIIPPLDPKTVMTPNPELMARGKVLYTQTCVTCHGPEGRGNGPAGLSLNPKPRDFTKNAGWKNGTHLDEIFRTLDEGIKGSAMVSYNDLSKRDRMALVHVVQSLGAFDHGASDPQARASLELLFASAGEEIPNRIPVSAAVRRLTQEAQAVPPVTDRERPVVGEGISDAGRAAQTLAGIPGWREDAQAFSRGVLAGLSSNGFAPRVATFTEAEWREFHDTLARR
jgi:mono/diheme cytochrome c family protein